MKTKKQALSQQAISNSPLTLEDLETQLKSKARAKDDAILRVNYKATEEKDKIQSDYQADVAGIESQIKEIKQRKLHENLAPLVNLQDPEGVADALMDLLFQDKRGYLESSDLTFDILEKIRQVVQEYVDG